MRRAALLALLAAGCAIARAPPAPSPHPEPEVVGVTHVVAPGETLWRIARAYRVSPEEVALANHLPESAKVVAGQELFIPGAAQRAEVPPSDAVPPVTRPPRRAEATLAWPLAGVLYARFGPRGDSRHDGIDIAAPASSVVRAAADGEVLFAGEQKGYGHVVVLGHPGGLITLYAHNQGVLVREGARVRAGDALARVGEALKTSGPHLHFEVRLEGKPVDPLEYLPAPN